MHINFFFFDRDYLRDGLFSGKRISKEMSWLLSQVGLLWHRNLKGNVMVTYSEVGLLRHRNLKGNVMVTYSEVGLLRHRNLRRNVMVTY